MFDHLFVFVDLPSHLTSTYSYFYAIVCCYCLFLMDTACIFIIRFGICIVFDPFFQVLSRVTRISHTPEIFDKAISILTN